MKIALIYFNEDLPNNRKHHSVNFQILRNWLSFYTKSNNKFGLHLLLDDKTNVPFFWRHGFTHIKDCNPPNRKDVLHKVGWLKSQAYDILGKCLVVDIDALIIKDISYLSNIDCEIAMSPDEGTKKKWVWAKSWPEATNKYNAGVLLLNSNKIRKEFVKLWKEKKEYMNYTFYDEIIFSSLMTTLKSQVLPESYNTLYSGNTNNSCNILHFSGQRKNSLLEYCKKMHNSLI